MAMMADIENKNVDKCTFQHLLDLVTVEPLYSEHHRDPAGCPECRDVPNSEVDLYTVRCSWDGRHCPR